MDMTKNMTEEQIFEEVKAIIVKLFEIEPERVVPEANLFEDLELDSIDAVDMVVQLQKKTGRKVDPAVFKQVRTVQDVVKAVADLLASKPQA